MVSIMMVLAEILKRFISLFKLLFSIRNFLYLISQNIRLKTIIYIFILLTGGISASAQQFYLRGEVKDESGNPLQNVTILQQTTGFIYKTGTYGTFGIITNKESDTLTFSLDGFLKEKAVVHADNYVTIRLKILKASASTLRRDKLASLTKNLEREEQRKWFAGDETYASLVENRFINASKYPVTGLSLNIDRASYSNIRRFINLNSFVPPDAVRIEEMLNYFNLDYIQPKEGDVFNVSTRITSCPWNQTNQLFFINLSSRKINLDTLPPTHLVFLIDISGSMDMSNRLPLLKSSFRMLVNNLREKDSVSIVVYGGTTGVMLNTTSGAEKEKILRTIDELTPGGSTPGESGIKLAYSVAKNHFIKDGNNRIILATDGDFNVGMKTDAELDELISRHRTSGIYLTCLGVGMGNYKDSKIQTMARKGNGNFAYLDNFQEAEKVLLKEFTQTLYSVADDVYLNVSFNPDFVKEYRLIGFDNKLGALYDSLSTIEGGEIGSGHSMLAVFEIIPTEENKTVGKENIRTGDYGLINLRYVEPGDTLPREVLYNCRYNYIAFDKIEKCYQFYSSVILFGSILKASPFIKSSNWNDILAIALKSITEENRLQEEFIELVQKAKNLYSKQKKKKGRNTNL